MLDISRISTRTIKDRERKGLPLGVAESAVRFTERRGKDLSPAIDLLPVLFPSPASALPLHQRLLFQSVSPFCFPGGLFVCRWFCWRCCSFMIGLNASRRGKKKEARVGSSPFRITRGRLFYLLFVLFLRLCSFCCFGHGC